MIILNFKDIYIFLFHMETAGGRTHRFAVRQHTLLAHIHPAVIAK